MALSKPKALSLEDCHCLLCMEFLIEPITLPCNHTVCKTCFKALLRKTNIFCPFCRFQISSWARYHCHVNSFINKELWERIQTQYPEECRHRIPGEERPSLVFTDAPPVRVLSNPGELRKEYEEEMIRMEAERQAIKERQNRATEEYIRQLLAKELEEERMLAEKRKLEEQQQREKEEATKSCTSGPVTSSPRKKKSKQKHCENVPKFSLPQPQLESAWQYETVPDSKKMPGKRQKTKTEENMSAPTLSTSPENPKAGTLNSSHPFYSYDAKLGSSEDEAPKPSCSNYNSNRPSKNTKREATTHSSAQKENVSSDAGITEEIGNCTTEEKGKMPPPSGSKRTSKRKHQELPSEAAASDPAISHEIPTKSFLDDKDTQDFITKKMIDLEQLYYEKHLQEEQDRLFALELQRVLDEEMKEMWGEKSSRNYEFRNNDTSAKEDSKDKKNI
ncbi:E3 ubiquitin-protein ligase RNF168-like [Apodemus sylvaticus]|uniref:E3 ubiquitin-protein ligase RNF168-like n=1 Tax=Apodemus sylvaticus TaxID=10129 RepID=UPI0022445DA1|nr:E3 ubiquitin-protein ligase RNF168-like [Apodemus sylvaticus]